MPTGVASEHDVIIYHEGGRPVPLAGIVVTLGMTNVTLYRMVQINFKFALPGWSLHYRDQRGGVVLRNYEQLQPGDYAIASAGEVWQNTEKRTADTKVMSTGVKRTLQFQDAVRQRDGGCIITKDMAINAKYGIEGWTGFEACHIYPLSHHQLWVEHNCSRWVIPEGEQAGIDHGINSVKNGILLRRDIHALFDKFLVSIDADVCVTTVLFSFCYIYL